MYSTYNGPLVIVEAKVKSEIVTPVKLMRVPTGTS